MKHVKKFSYRKRSSLTSASSGVLSHVLAEVESSQDGEYTRGHHMITLAECRRQVHLDFPLATERERRTSLAKIELLVEIFIAFGTALQKEAQLIGDGSQPVVQRQKNHGRK